MRRSLFVVIVLLSACGTHSSSDFDGVPLLDKDALIDELYRDLKKMKPVDRKFLGLGSSLECTFRSALKGNNKNWKKVAVKIGSSFSGRYLNLEMTSPGGMLSYSPARGDISKVQNLNFTLSKPKDAEGYGWRGQDAAIVKLNVHEIPVKTMITDDKKPSFNSLFKIKSDKAIVKTVANTGICVGAIPKKEEEILVELVRKDHIGLEFAGKDVSDFSFFTKYYPEIKTVHKDKSYFNGYREDEVSDVFVSELLPIVRGTRVDYNGKRGSFTPFNNQTSSPESLLERAKNLPDENSVCFRDKAAKRHRSSIVAIGLCVSK